MACDFHHDVLDADPARIVVRPGNLNEVSTGDTVTLSCVGYGDPLPSVFWSNSNNDMLINSSQITIFEDTLSESGMYFVKSILEVCNVETMMSGEYSCTSQNEFSNQTARFQLSVLDDGMYIHLYVHACYTIEGLTSSVCGYLHWLHALFDLTSLYCLLVHSAAAPVRIVVTPEDIVVGINSTLMLACVAYGEPTPLVGWSREGARLMNDSRVTIYKNEVTEGGLSFNKSILEICSFETLDRGQYSCDASNQAATASASFEVSGTVARGHKMCTYVIATLTWFSM